MDLTVRNESFVAEDQSWLGSRHGTDAADPITLDGTLAAAAADADGVVKSGIVLGKVTATGRYAPYLPGSSDGSQNPVGFLFTAQRLRVPLLGDASTVTHNVAGALLWHGEIVVAKLPVQSTGAGYLDAAAKAAMPLFRYV